MHWSNEWREIQEYKHCFKFVPWSINTPLKTVVRILPPTPTPLLDCRDLCKTLVTCSPFLKSSFLELFPVPSMGDGRTAQTDAFWPPGSRGSGYTSPSSPDTQGAGKEQWTQTWHACGFTLRVSRAHPTTGLPPHTHPLRSGDWIGWPLNSSIFNPSSAPRSLSYSKGGGRCILIYANSHWMFLAFKFRCIHINMTWPLSLGIYNPNNSTK